MKKILILVNDVTTILQFRSELVVSLMKNGHDVTVSVPYSERISELEQLGVKIIITKVSRHGKNPLQDLRLLKTYKKLIKKIEPNIVLTFTIKPNIYGGMACSSLKIPYIANITGLGIVNNVGLLQKLMLFLYKQGLKKAKTVFFQNRANKDFFIKKKIICNNAQLLPGSGVNVEKFLYTEYPSNDKINITFVGRIIKDKGVFELAEVAKRLLSNEQIKFTIVGDVEYGEVNPFTGLNNVACVGFHKDVRPYLRDAHAVVLPSYHEGMANVLLEAAACGRPILASNISGCKETFEQDISGLGFKPKNVDSLLETVSYFCSLPYETRRQMGIEGRKKIEKEFDRKIVIEQYIEQINLEG